ncbi:aspartate/glutamate racemase family protein [Marinomonas colpomeniae]|uniref:Amino acid racemase n=1 Tax=Marinomonas colpomeniae TaxID=2774408 RepID=A0ABR8NZ82_9GAMM|nr:amino acid racemase [Marinomonas colpomeniae]MBD5771356.1 amino acid racemase [Marinomonas colpomeniae]
MHKKIGIIGGLSPESTVSYYLHITRSYVEKYGNYGYPEIIIYSVNLKNFHQRRDEGRWDLIAEDLARVANELKTAGADFGLIATNTMHKVFDDVQNLTSLPLINLINTTALDVKKKSISKVALLGTKFTMGEDFYVEGLKKQDISTIVPSFDDQQVIHSIIVNELVRGIISDASRKQYIDIINKLRSEGAEGVILGCTEIPLLIKQADCDIPIIDTATIHAEEALLRAISH